MLSAKAANRKDLSAKPATMTHQHFRQIAAILREMPVHSATLRVQRDSCINAFATKLAGTNPNFDRARFVSACYAERES